MAAGAIGGLVKRNDWIQSIRKLPEICKRLDDVQVEHGIAGTQMLDRYDSPDNVLSIWTRHTYLAHVAVVRVRPMRWPTTNIRCPHTTPECT